MTEIAKKAAYDIWSLGIVARDTMASTIDAAGVAELVRQRDAAMELLDQIEQRFGDLRMGPGAVRTITDQVKAIKTKGK